LFSKTRGKVFYGWYIIAALFFINLIIIGNRFSFGVFFKSLANEFEGCDLAGYNSNKFDIPLLAEEFLRADVDFDMRKRKFICSGFVVEGERRPYKGLVDHQTLLCLII